MDNSTLSATANAKINLALHVTDQREDGYHFIESLVAFADFGDQITAQTAKTNSLEIRGPFAKELTDDSKDNLIIKARDALARYARVNGHQTHPVSLVCEKNLPVASGLGGGSADAAATLNILIELWKLDISDQELATIALGLGADVPMCLKSKALIAEGIGENITMVNSFPQSPIVLVNPMVQVSTPIVFETLTTKQNGHLHVNAKINSIPELIDIVQQNRNDLQIPAVHHCPEISTCLNALKLTKPSIVRMSGSGASCFAIYEEEKNAFDAAQRIRTIHPDWFVKFTHLLGQSKDE